MNERAIATLTQVKSTSSDGKSGSCMTSWAMTEGGYGVVETEPVILQKCDNYLRYLQYLVPYRTVFTEYLTRPPSAAFHSQQYVSSCQGRNRQCPVCHKLLKAHSFKRHRVHAKGHQTPESATSLNIIWRTNGAYATRICCRGSVNTACGRWVGGSNKRCGLCRYKATNVSALWGPEIR
jgi:hypothetical protein